MRTIRIPVPRSRGSFTRRAVNLGTSYSCSNASKNSTLQTYRRIATMRSHHEMSSEAFGHLSNHRSVSPALSTRNTNANLVANKRETKQKDVRGGKRLSSIILRPIHHGAFSNRHRLRSLNLPSQTSNKYEDGDRLPIYRK